MDVVCIEGSQVATHFFRPEYLVREVVTREVKQDEQRVVKKGVKRGRSQLPNPAPHVSRQKKPKYQPLDQMPALERPPQFQTLPMVNFENSNEALVGSDDCPFLSPDSFDADGELKSPSRFKGSVFSESSNGALAGEGALRGGDPSIYEYGDGLKAVV